ncbi:uncharacterized protein BX664DRAFT_361730 [Halteromyces radiatus]|uniref:uncharacterized protein n=1 Tax=Halteromyces radiatus TaxID=101107 RepID=UPI00221F0C0E|nr:uncharacterized protein BX664DRAFT_361730 [Halteromyces radiatus]KAI8081584.1 hypothetical protein BX664DRAFT_361730 [Halteromyces radiatus]
MCSPCCSIRHRSNQKILLDFLIFLLALYLYYIQHFCYRNSDISSLSSFFPLLYILHYTNL